MWIKYKNKYCEYLWYGRFHIRAARQFKTFFFLCSIRRNVDSKTRLMRESRDWETKGEGENERENKWEPFNRREWQSPENYHWTDRDSERAWAQWHTTQYSNSTSRDFGCILVNDPSKFRKKTCIWQISRNSLLLPLPYRNWCSGARCIDSKRKRKRHRKFVHDVNYDKIIWSQHHSKTLWVTETDRKRELSIDNHSGVCICARTFFIIHIATIKTQAANLNSDRLIDIFYVRTTETSIDSADFILSLSCYFFL